ncbi:hypothetical protein ACWTU6_02010 [Mesorhizobium sp. BHbsci]
MKRERFEVELVTEVAKNWTYERNLRLGDQLSVLAEQHWRLERLKGQVEWVVTDSSIPLSLIYAKPEDAEWLEEVVQVLWDRFDNYPMRLRGQRRPRSGCSSAVAASRSKTYGPPRLQEGSKA